MEHAAEEEVVLAGHLIDSWILPRVFDTIMDMGGDYEVLEMSVGRRKAETTKARLLIRASSAAALEAILSALEVHGASPASPGDAVTAPAPRDGVLPEDFYSTTNLPTDVRLAGVWVEVRPVEMDVAIVVSPEGTPRTCPMSEVRAGEDVVVGHRGIRVHPLERARESEVFSFMSSSVSPEKPKKVVIHEIAREMERVRAARGRTLFVAGPAIIHSGAGPYLEALIRGGFIQALFAGNAVAVHDVESALFDTSLGVDLGSATVVEGGHRHHMRAINRVRNAGSFEQAVASGLLQRGVMYEAVRAGIDVVLGGSIRDDGPLPGVITDVIEAQRAMRAAVAGVDLVLMVASMLHGIATGNLLPATVRTVVVDVNPSVVTKLADRGSWQAVGLVTDAELFLRELTQALGLPAETAARPHTTMDAS